MKFTHLWAEWKKKRRALCSTVLYLWGCEILNETWGRSKRQCLISLWPTSGPRIRHLFTMSLIKTRFLPPNLQLHHENRSFQAFLQLMWPCYYYYYYIFQAKQITARQMFWILAVITSSGGRGTAIPAISDFDLWTYDCVFHSLCFGIWRYEEELFTTAHPYSIIPLLFHYY